MIILKLKKDYQILLMVTSMILNDYLLSSIKKVVNNKINIDKSVRLEVKKSKTTNSIYVIASTEVLGNKITKEIRFSDHGNSKIKTLMIKKETNFELIIKLIKRLVRDILSYRYYVALNSI